MEGTLGRRGWAQRGEAGGPSAAEREGVSAGQGARGWLGPRAAWSQAWLEGEELASAPCVVRYEPKGSVRAGARSSVERVLTGNQQRWRAGQAARPSVWGGGGRARAGAAGEALVCPPSLPAQGLCASLNSLAAGSEHRALADAQTPPQHRGRRVPVGFFFSFLVSITGCPQVAKLLYFHHHLRASDVHWLGVCPVSALIQGEGTGTCESSALFSGLNG